MAATRLLRSSKPLHNPCFPSSSSFSSTKILRCVNKAGESGEKGLCGNVEKRKSKPVVVMKASVAASEAVVISEPQTTQGIDLLALLANITDPLFMFLRTAVKRKSWKLRPQIFIESAIINCRFFSFFGVAGSLLGSILCFVEGCFMIVESYLQYFHAISQKSDQGHVVQLVIEAIDMFLVGTAMLMFGMGLYAMFVGTRNLKERGTWLSGSNFFGLFRLKSLPSWIEMQSVSQAKSRIGHSVMMILQVGILEKFKSIPLVTGLDLACFAGAVFISSACIFLLSRLSIRSATEFR